VGFIHPAHRVIHHADIGFSLDQRVSDHCWQEEPYQVESWAQAVPVNRSSASADLFEVGHKNPSCGFSGPSRGANTTLRQIVGQIPP
jgi:hypothetical protein